MSQFQNLSTKATRRGIKKCTKCGIFNGTKSLACKNKECNMIFKESSDKRKMLTDAVQLMTGNFRKLYSVRVRDRGPDYRGFVQLPLSSSTVADARSQLSEVALCLVDNCPRLFQDSLLQCHETHNENLWDTTNSCPHISASAKCRFTATPLTLKLHIILKLKSTKEIQEKLWIITNESTIPIVQRVSKNVMAVRCQVTPKHPLGYLHFIFNNKDRRSYFCDCSDFVHNKKCIHFYLCICALASNSKYAQEFSHLINTEFKDLDRGLLSDPLELSDKIDLPNPIKAKKNYSSMTDSTIKNVKCRREKSGSYTKCGSKRKIWPRVYPIQINIVNDTNSKEVHNQETNPTWSFDCWLSYAVESMNKLIIFENAGLLNSLVFNIPLDFYRALRKRIPSEYLTMIQDILDYEVIHIMNIRHVKEILANTKVKLRVSKRFILTQDSSYMEVDESGESAENLMPHFIYFLNVGQLTVDDSDNTNNPFVIEWILNTGHNSIGQLKFQYKYGRKCL